jgi:hypothetical protein
VLVRSHDEAMAQVLAYLAAAVIAVWGVSHAMPTRQVVAGFEPTAVDNHRVILQEWIIEAVAMWGLAGLVFAVTLIGGDASVVDGVYRVVAGILVAFAVVTALTGARTSVIWFKICPVLLIGTAAVLVAASLV